MTVRFPTTGAIAGDLYGMVLRELTLCQATSHETVVVFTDTRTNTNYAAAFLAAAKEVAASAFEIKIPLLPGTEGNDTDVAPVVEILKTAHLVVDVTTGGVLYLYSRTLADVLSGGTRVLQVRGTEDQLRRCFPDEAVRRRTLNGARKQEEAGEIRVTTETGTDLSMRKDGRRGVTQYGISDVPGRWDSWPSGFLYCAPLEDSANGTLMLDPGDLLVMLGRYVQQPVRIEVKEGQITAVEGGSVGLALLLALIYLIYGFFCLYLLMQMVLRLALIDLLLVLAPAAMGLWILPHSSGWSRHWLRLFVTTVFQQAVQLIALALGIGFLAELASIGAFEPARDLIWKLLMSLAFIYLATRVPSMLGNSSPFDAWLQTLWFGLSLPATMARSVASVAAIGAGGGATASKALSSGGSAGSSGVGGATRSAAQLSTPQGGSEPSGRGPRSQNE